MNTIKNNFRGDLKRTPLELYLGISEGNIFHLSENRVWSTDRLMREVMPGHLTADQIIDRVIRFLKDQDLGTLNDIIIKHPISGYDYAQLVSANKEKILK